MRATVRATVRARPADAFDASETTLIYFVFYDSLDYAFFWRSSWFGGISVITNS